MHLFQHSALSAPPLVSTVVSDCQVKSCHTRLLEGSVIYAVFLLDCMLPLQLVLYNSSILYFNPSDTDDCVSYTQKRIFAFRQVGCNQSPVLLCEPVTIKRLVSGQAARALLQEAFAWCHVKPPTAAVRAPGARGRWSHSMSHARSRSC